MIALRNLDLVLLAIAHVVFLVLDLPFGGWLTAAGIWAMWRGIGWWSERRAANATDPKQVVGIAAGSMIGRGWLVALTIFAAGLTDEDAGLAAAVLVIVLFTAYFTVSMIMRPFDTDTSRQPS